MEQPPERPILVISPDWRTRALLAAQLGETTGCEVLSAPAPNEGRLLLRLIGVLPALLVVDAGQELTAEEVERLLDALSTVPAVLVVSALRRTSFAPLAQRCAAVLVRPVSIGQIARAAAALLPGGAQRPREEQETA